MKEIIVRTQNNREFVDITAQIEKAVRDMGSESGICHLYVPHTTAAVTINESADYAVKEDIIDALTRLIPSSLDYKHIEGNAHAHIQASLIGSSESVPVVDGKIQMGTWQGIFFCEFDGPRERKLWITLTQSH